LFSKIKLSAILVGLFIHITSAILFFVFIYIVFGNSKEGKDSVAVSISIPLVFLLLISRILIYLAIGYITAKISKTQPLLHGFICGCFAVAFNFTFVSYSLFTMFLSLPTIVTGAWIYKIQASKNA
jgi:hypothetical protein